MINFCDNEKERPEKYWTDRAFFIKEDFYMMIVFSVLFFAGDALTVVKARADGYEASWIIHNSFRSALGIWLIFGVFALWCTWLENRNTLVWLAEYPEKYAQEVRPNAENGLTQKQAESITLSRRQQLDREKNEKERYLAWLKTAAKIVLAGAPVLAFFSIVL